MPSTYKTRLLLSVQCLVTTFLVFPTFRKCRNLDIVGKKPMMNSCKQLKVSNDNFCLSLKLNKTYTEKELKIITRGRNKIRIFLKQLDYSFSISMR